MAQPLDPWRTLGLTPGSTAEDVRRAYRRLAKANHPDAAGEQALPRFLEIQAAYELLAGGGTRRRPGARPGARGSAGNGRAAEEDVREPWRADPDRARASGRADRRRPGARPPGAASGTGSTAGRGPSAGEAGDNGSAPPGGAPPGRRRTREEARPGPSGESSGETRSRRPGGRRRAPNRATPYSTSYDPADEEPFEPGWSGATWYGASSGTYWTINPKEYADPRKHGPEYQRRARRSANGWILDDGADTEADVSPAEGEASAGPKDDVDQMGPEGPPSETRAGGAKRASSTGAHRRPEDPSSTGPDRTSSGNAGALPGTDPARPRSRAGSGETWTDARAGAAATERSDGAARPAASATAPADWGVSERTQRARFTGPLLPVVRTPFGRLVIALLGWPPLGLAVAAVIGEETGCGRFAASCSELNAPGTWLVQVAIVVLLLALPAVARWSAHGTVAMLVVGLPSAIVLSAGGGSRQPEASSATLAVLLLIAYVVGVGYALVLPLVRRRSEPPAGT